MCVSADTQAEDGAELFIAECSNGTIWTQQWTQDRPTKWTGNVTSASLSIHGKCITSVGSVHRELLGLRDCVVAPYHWYHQTLGHEGTVANIANFAFDEGCASVDTPVVCGSRIWLTYPGLCGTTTNQQFMWFSAGKHDTLEV